MVVFFAMQTLTMNHIRKKDCYLPEATQNLYCWELKQNSFIMLNWVQLMVELMGTVWRELVNRSWNWDQNPVMTFLIKNRINTYLFIDETAALYKVDDQTDQRWNWSEGGQPLVLVDPRIEYTVDLFKINIIKIDFWKH